MKKKIRRIGIFGGPGCGKDTVASFLFHKLKIENYNCELISEYIKTWTYHNRLPKPWHQWYISGNQNYREFEALEAGFDFIITPSPLLLQCYYGKRLGFKGWQQCAEMVQEFEKEYPSLNIFLMRGDIPYHQNGRFQDKKEAIKIDDEVLRFAGKYSHVDHFIGTENLDMIYDVVKQAIGENYADRK